MKSAADDPTFAAEEMEETTPPQPVAVAAA